MVARKYKFFIKQNSITFRQGAGLLKDGASRDECITEEWGKRFWQQDLDRDTVIEVADVEAVVAKLMRDMKVIRAAGGYVLNAQGYLLMIHRRGFWDLPKGKTEKGETISQTALREVEEECGVSSLNIVSEPFSTFHIYQEKGETIIKESVWFKMATSHTGALSPQTEEDITKAQWVVLPVAREIRDGAYASINEVLDHFA